MVQTNVSNIIARDYTWVAAGRMNRVAVISHEREFAPGKSQRIYCLVVQRACVPSASCGPYRCIDAHFQLVLVSILGKWLEAARKTISIDEYLSCAGVALSIRGRPAVINPKFTTNAH
eukprot:SAG31_NODE_610_length_13564_cov_3.189528_8_plen_118_part_00